MARPLEPWKLRAPEGKRTKYSVRFTWEGEPVERSCGTADPERAAKEAARIYAHHVSLPPRKRISAPALTGSAAELDEALRRWLASLKPTLDAGTVGCYAGYADSHWLEFFGALHGVTSARVLQYRDERLGQVVANTVRKELSALRGFCSWALADGLIPEVVVPSVPKRTTGTKFGQRRRVKAIALSPAEVRKLIAALPEWSTSKRVEAFPIRARFRFAYETGLRPELIDQISVPEHYRPGATHLNITPELDKGRWARPVKLSKAARKALDSVCPEKGVIFGAHDYRDRLATAAAAALPPDRAELFAGAHLRSARATHWLDAGRSLTGVQYQLGQKRMETTAKYARPSQRAGDAVIKD